LIGGAPLLAVPEPSAFLTMVSGLLVLVGVSRARNKSAGRASI
jgi:hypothetical protein